MATQLTVRLPEELKESLQRASERMDLNVSEIVRLALQEFLRMPGRAGARPAERVRALLGSLESKTPDLAERHRSYILESLKRGG